MRAMRVCVFGAGAVGGNIAVMLARAGADVSVLVRGATLQAVRARGLELHTPDGVVRANVRARRPARTGRAGCGAGHRQADRAHRVRAGHLLGRDTPAVFLQNGIPWWYFHGQGNADEGRRIPELGQGTCCGTQSGRSARWRRHVEPVHGGRGLAW
jgi:2-dehydropantoate 2-reductase